MLHRLTKIFPLLLCLSSVTGCFSSIPNTMEETKPPPTNSSVPAVDVITVRRQVLTPPRQYIGTSQPIKTVTVRSQGEGQLLSLSVDVGDRINQGEVVAQLDDSLPQVAVNREQGQLARLQAELTEAEAEVISAQANVKSQEIQLLQAQVDLERLQQLYQEGAIAKREVELARTQARTNEQLLASAQSQVKVRQARIRTIKSEIKSQKAVIAAERERLTFTQIKAPNSGYVLAKLTEVGSLIRIGEELLTVGDLSQIQVRVAVSELDLDEIQLNNSVKITFDAFGDEEFIGIVDNIYPAADIEARQIPIDILINNPSRKIKSGLLARVSFIDNTPTPIIIPRSALTINRDASQNIVFILEEENQIAKVKARLVDLGKMKNDKVEVLSGIENGERIVTRSTDVLKHDQEVRLSAISLSQE